MRGTYYSGGRTNRGGRSNRGSTVYPERGVQRGRYGIGHVLQIISDPLPMLYQHCAMMSKNREVWLISGLVYHL